MTLQTLARAKINLYLHVTGRREDGYHFLDSLVAFAGAGDVLALSPADSFSFVLTGPKAEELRLQDPKTNLVVRAAEKMAREFDRAPAFVLTLVKNLPTASGIGGGSADAAAALRLVAMHWGLALADPALQRIAASLGQDVPCCLNDTPCYFEGVGDRVSPACALPYVPLVLVNPGVALPTPAVFAKRTGPFGPAAARESEPPNSARALVDRLEATRNDLTEAAIALCPPIATILDVLAKCEGCLLSRMSGSGATCFGLFEDRGAAKNAAACLHQMHPEWWVAPTHLHTP